MKIENVLVTYSSYIFELSVFSSFYVADPLVKALLAKFFKVCTNTDATKNILSL